MKAFRFIVPALIVVLFAACSNAQTKEKSKVESPVEVVANSSGTINVSGNCEMCKERIEKAAKIEGVAVAEWVSETKLLAVSFDSALINLDAIAKSIAAAGHDNEKAKADDNVYGALPGCCQYER